MADYVNPASTDIVLSVDAMPAPWISCTRENSLVWLTIPGRYRKWVKDHIEEMTPAERAAIDTALLAEARDAAASALQQAENVQRALMLVVLDELNAHALKLNAILDAIDAGANLTAIKTNISAIADYAQRTEAQLRTAVRNKLGT